MLFQIRDWVGMWLTNWFVAELQLRRITMKGRVGESRADFVHKVNIALKELVETRGWLKFIVTAQLLSPQRVERLLDECDQLCRILGKSISTAKANGKSLRASPTRRLPMTNVQ